MATTTSCICRRRPASTCSCRGRAHAQPAATDPSQPAHRVAGGAVPGGQTQARRRKRVAVPVDIEGTRRVGRHPGDPGATSWRKGSCWSRWMRSSRRSPEGARRSRAGRAGRPHGEAARTRAGAAEGHLRDTVEQYEASTEELKASNEELQAMNEELRSATEELETSREELQSINEELTTVNQELKSQGGRAGACQQRPAQPDGRDRDRHDLPRSRAAHHALHAHGGRAVQPDSHGHRPAAHRPDAPPRLRRPGAGRRAGAGKPGAGRARGRAAPGALVPRPPAAVPDGGRPHRRRGADVRRRHRAATAPARRSPRARTATSISSTASTKRWRCWK